VVAPKIKQTYICSLCESEKAEDKFFKNSWSDLFKITDGHPTYCKECINKDFEKMAIRYESEKIALKIWCYKLDLPYYEGLYQSITESNSNFGVGMYMRQIQMRQYQYKTFLNSIVDGELTKTVNEIKEDIESKWTKKDKQNMNYSISTVGYDPFDDSGMTDMDRKYCFNILAVYCDVDGVKKDGHKLQSVIQLTNLHMQCKKIDESMNQQLLQAHSDENRLKNLTGAKKQLLDSISKIAQDNNIASNYNKNSKQGQNSLSAKMKEMESNGFEEIKVNLFDIKTCEAMKQIADLSNESIMDQLTFDSSDYSEMIKEQREMILKYEQTAEAINEENRLLKNQIIDLEQVKKR